MARKLLSSVLFALAAALLIATPVLAYLYRAPLSVTENASTSYDMLAVLWYQNNTWLAANGFMNSTANDTRVQTLGGSDKPWMVADNKTLTAVPVPANSQTNLYFVTGESEASAMDIILGYDGYVTISDTDPLEIRDDFDIELSGWIDTSVVGANITQKGNVFRTYISAANEITAVFPTGSFDTRLLIGEYNNYLYVITTGDVTSDVYLYKVSPTTLTPVDSLLIDASGWGSTSGIIDGSTAYIQLDDNPAEIVKVDLSSFTITTSLTLGVGEYGGGGQGTMEISGTDLYVTENNEIVKVDLTTFTRTAALPYTHTGYLRAVGSYLYNVSRTVVKIDLTTFTITDNLSLSLPPFATSNQLVLALADNTTNLFAGRIMSINTGGWFGIVYSVDLSSFTESDNFTTCNTTNNLDYHEVRSMTVSGDNLFMGFQNGSISPDILVGKASLSTFSSTDNYTNSTDEGRVLSLLSDSGDLYALNYESMYNDDRLDSGLYRFVEASFPVLDGAGEPVQTDIAVVATGVTGDDHVLKVGADGVDLAIYVDDMVVPEDTEALNGSSVLDTADDWVIMSGNSAPYLDYYQHTVNSTLVVWYQPNAIISGTTLPDREGVAQNGVITWGSNPSGAGATIGSLVSSSQPGVGSASDTSTRNILPIAGGSDWEPSTEVSPTLLTNPLRPIVVAISDNTTLSEYQVWVWFGLIFVVFVTVLTGTHVRGHHLVTGIAASAAIVLLVVWTVWPILTLLIIVLAILGGLVSERSPAL